MPVNCQQVTFLRLLAQITKRVKAGYILDPWHRPPNHSKDTFQNDSVQKYVTAS